MGSCDRVPAHMAEAKAKAVETKEAAEAVLRIYEVGYHVVPTVKEEDVEKITGDVRAVIEKQGGTFIAEGAPTLTKLSYEISGTEGGKRVDYDRAYFGWIKFEAPSMAAALLEKSLLDNKNILRSMVFRTVREDTRARVKTPTLREVRRGETLKAAPHQEEASAPVSEVDLEKAIQDITTD